MKKISIVIPVYNEQNFIGQVLASVVKSDTLGLKKELIIVDDASSDQTRSVIEEFISKNKGKNKDITFQTYFKKNNEGKGSCLKAGFELTTGDIVLVQDADLEYNPNDYPIMLEPFLKNEANVVYGSRFISNRPHRVLYFWHYQINLFITLLSNMFTNLSLTDIETGYKAFKGDLIRQLADKLESKRFGFEPEITARIAKIKGIKIYEVGISYAGRTYEEGKKIGWKDGIKVIWEILFYNLLKS